MIYRPISKKVSLSPLSLGLRAELFSQLAAMEKAGLPVKKAFGLVRLSAAARPKLDVMSRLIALGYPIADAGLRSALFNSLEWSLIKAASDAGNLEHAYRRLADQYWRRVAQMSAIKSRMMPPFATLVLGILISPLPRLVSGSLSFRGYLLGCVLELLVLAGAVYYVLLEMSQRRPHPSAFDRFTLRIPLFGAMNERRNVRDFLESLALLIEAGVPILQALPVATDTIQNGNIKTRFLQIKPRIEQGASFSVALDELRFAGPTSSSELIKIGEASGALPDTLFRCANGETETINYFDQTVAEWLPRLVYILTALLIAYSVVRSGAFEPSLPPDLK